MMDQWKREIEEELERLVSHSSSFSPSLYEGARYSLLASAKRIRPLLTLAAATLFDPTAQAKALRPACALELVHTYSLIHDDLPAMDDDDYRRGKPTLHKIYNEGHAILVGDYLITFAFEVLAKSPQLSAQQRLDLVETLAVAAGGEGMVGGQVMDIEGSSYIDEMHTRKTGALFEAALKFGGIVANVSPDVLHKLSRFGIQFGKVFQGVDDLVDEDYPLGYEKTREFVDTAYQEALAILKELDLEHSTLHDLIEKVMGYIAFKL